MNSKTGDKRFDKIKVNPARFFVAWTLQGMWVFVTSIAMVVQVTSPHAESSLITSGSAGSIVGRSPTPLETFFDFATIFGLILFVAGFILEVAADGEKKKFSADPKNHGRCIDQGVWTWCRHPNYFGEILIWVGIFTLGFRTYQQSQWATAISPVLVMVLLLFVSGLPQLESGADKKWGHEAEYQAYKKRTHSMIPFLSRLKKV